MQSYLNLLRDVMDNGEGHDDRTGVGTRSVFGRQWRHDMREGFPLLTTKRVTLRWVFEELRWFLSGSTDANALRERGVTIWDEWATAEQCGKFGRAADNLGPIYGKQWRQFGDELIAVDQIERLLNDIEKTPQSRRMIVSAWHAFESKLVTLPPCHTLWQVKCHAGANRGMSLHLYARSIDIFLGLPYNIASYALLLEMLCKVTGYEARDLIVSFGDLHLYNNHVEAAKTQLSREPKALCDVNVIESAPTGDYSALTRLLAIQWKNIEVIDYDNWPKIEAPVAV